MKNTSLFFLLILGLTISSPLLFAQLQPKGSMGLQFGKVFGADTAFRGLQQGLSIQFKRFYFTTIGSHAPLASSNLDERVEGKTQLVSLGFQHAFAKFALADKRIFGVRGYSIYPKAGIGYSQWSSRGFSSAGINIHASMVLNVPFLSLDAGISSIFMWPGSNPAGRKTYLYPHVSVRMDGLFEALCIATVYDGTRERTEVVEYSYVSRRDITGAATEITSVKESYQERTAIYRMAVDPFIGIAPRYSYLNVGYKGTTQQIGVGVSARKGQGGFDFIYSKGVIGYGAQTIKSYLHDPFPAGSKIDKKNAQFLAEGEATLIFATMSTNLTALLYRMMGVPIDRGDPSDQAKPSAIRYMIGIGGGYAKLGKPHFISDVDNAAMDQIFIDEPDRWQSSATDPRLSKSGWFLSTMFSIEYGVVCFRFENLYFDKYLANLASGKMYTITYIIPIGPISRAYKFYNLIKKPNE
jgi:hypothetical protein